MKIVYVAKTGCYDNQGVSGIYDSPERAIAAHHRDGWVWTRQLWHYKSGTSVRSGGFQDWENDQDWEDAVSIRAYELTDEGELRAPDKIIMANDRGNRVVYEDITADEADELVATPPLDDEDGRA